MKGKGSWFRTPHFFGLSVLVLAGAAILANTAGLSAQWTEEEYEWCRQQGYHLVQIEGAGEFIVASTEEISGIAGAKYRDGNGLSVLPIGILGMSGQGHAEGVGTTTYWLDHSRPVAGSGMRAKTQGSSFPAVHEMRFHLLLITDSLPGRTFRSINPAVMVNNNALSFPPKVGSRYVLRNAVELEDVNDPGKVVLRILSNRNETLATRHVRSGLNRLRVPEPED